MSMSFFLGERCANVLNLGIDWLQNMQMILSYDYWAYQLAYVKSKW